MITTIKVEFPQINTRTKLKPIKSTAMNVILRTLSEPDYNHTTQTHVLYKHIKRS